MARKVDEAVRTHSMIVDGDRIMVGVSGGKDSLALVSALIYRKKHAPEDFDFVCGHVMADANGPTDEEPQGLREWLESEGIALHSAQIIVPETETFPMDCERCARNRRRTLFILAREHGCNKLALGHNRDDFAETALVNLLERGKLETMAYNSEYFKGEFRLVRPLAYLRSNDLARFARAAGLPVTKTKCPLAEATKRSVARDMMREMKKHFRHADANLVRAARANACPGEYVVDEDIDLIDGD